MPIGQEVELEIEGREEPITVRYSAVDLRRYESQFRKSVLIEPMSLTMLTYLGWSAAKRTGALNGAYEKWPDFDAVCIGVRAIPNEESESKETDEEAGPTQPDPSGD